MTAVESVELRAELLHLIQLGLGIFWLVAASAKLRAPRAAEETVRTLLFRAGVAAGWGPRVVVATVVAVEGAIGLMLLSGWQARPAALASLAVLVVFIGVLAADAVLESRATVPAGGCGCLGALRVRPAPLADGGGSRIGLPAAVARNFVLAVVSLGVAAGVHGACGCEANDGAGPSLKVADTAAPVDASQAALIQRNSRHD